MHECVAKLFLFVSVLVLCKLTAQQQIRRNSRVIGPGSSWFGDLETSRARVAGVSSRRGRFLSLFTYVQLNNPECVSTNEDYGICTTAAECNQRGGMVDGPCAGGYGTCCIFMVSCGRTIRENGTYFVNNGYPEPFDGTDSCQATLLKASQDVCQFRLDFEQLNLVGPEEVNHICNTDQFIVSGGNPVPTICGNSMGNHMYIDAGAGVDNPITLSVVTSGSSFQRNWKIRVLQIPCTSLNRGEPSAVAGNQIILYHTEQKPGQMAIYSVGNIAVDSPLYSYSWIELGVFYSENGCLQYFTGVAGQILSFNYDPTTGAQLSNQDYGICIRAERNFCGIQYTQCPDPTAAENGCLQYFTGVAGQILSFNYDPTTGAQLSNQDYGICIRAERNFCGIQYTQCLDPTAVNNLTQSFTLSGNSRSRVPAMVGTSGPNSCQADYLIIPMASNVGRPITGTAGTVDRICGGVLSAEVSTLPSSVKTNVKPFHLWFHTDGVEAPNDSDNKGFCLNYIQLPCSSTLS